MAVHIAAEDFADVKQRRTNQTTLTTVCNLMMLFSNISTTSEYCSDAKQQRVSRGADRCFVTKSKTYHSLGMPYYCYVKQRRGANLITVTE
jgi:hypothetical protein